MITHVQIAHVPVADQDRAKEFYIDKLGLTVVADMDGGPHGRWLQVAPEGAATSLALTPGEGNAQPGSATVVFECPDVAAARDTLRDRDVELPHEIEHMPWAAALRFTDPDGNIISLQSPAVMAK